MSKPIVKTPLRRAQKGKAPSLEWARWVEAQIRRIAEVSTLPIRQLASSRQASHPFKIFAAEEAGDCRVHVWRGGCTAHGWVWDSTDVWGRTLEIEPPIGSGVMISETVPIGNVAAGYLTLTAPGTGTTDYGIWLTVSALNEFPAASIYSPITGLFPDDLTVHFQTFNFGSAGIVASSDWPDLGDAQDMGQSGTVGDKTLAIYLGKVVVDADGNGVVTQYRKSDADVHAPLLTAPVVVSTDTSGGTNTINPGTDGGAYLP